ncbi:PREDICTED: 3-oxoacyl-[acyl-carrier-protein] synthase, mitochondrial-like [Rhagoletis zephyria]|uniref:3-oxoacyl-[acyl-carrier-protein] synthase, mitochondrial-like n=1 Tax=Rhagoletis zephyria TaxID=28612 RepID=UPI000811A23F|nr:PREDICTED: 3-oxoacyl-[acyl-carrier-protein] synthase, mitochondrial-like [Rhagoletis zephyria]
MTYVARRIFHTQLGKDLRYFSRANSGTPRRRVVVTGTGAVSPLANNVPLSWSRILAGESAISSLSDKFKGLPCQVAAQINRDQLPIEKHFSKSDLKIMSGATQLAMIAAEEALSNAKLRTSEFITEQQERFGVCVGMGMFDLTEVYGAWQQLQRGYNRVSPYFVPRLLPNMACGHISMRHGLRGPNHSVSTACATGAHAIGDALRFIRNGDADAMLAGSGESCIDPLSIAGFCRLRALSTTHNGTPLSSSRPFDKKRDGFVMGEGAAILVLEELEHARKRGAPILAELLGYGVSGDAHHITSPSEDGTGATLAMQRAIIDAGVQSTDITYVNAHATSTPTGDRIEAHAIQRVFGEHASQVRVSSTKGAHGHLLGSSGNLEAVFVVQACAENQLPPSINIEHLDESISVPIVQNKSEKWHQDTKARRIALKNSFGFGGTNASICIADYRD